MEKVPEADRERVPAGIARSLRDFSIDAVVDGASGWSCDGLAAAQLGALPGETGFRLLIAGHEAFLARMFLIHGARRTLDLQYYLFGGDITGALLSAAILRAADRGVQVRLLVDGWSLFQRDYQAALLNMHPNVEIRLFNPVSGHAMGALAGVVGVLANPRRLNRRMHNKVFIADGQIVILGGRNVGDHYFGFSREFGFRDIDVLGSGALLASVCASFDAYWNSESTKTLHSIGIRGRSAAEFARFRNRLAALRKQGRIAGYEKQLLRTRLARDLADGNLALTWGQARLIADPPDKVSALLTTSLSPLEQLVELAQSVRREVWLVSPYFVPGMRGLSVLESLRARGIRVVLITNSLASTDIVAVHSGYRRYRRRLLELGVEIREVKPSWSTAGRRGRLFGVGRGSLHAKTYVFDRSQVIIGSLNLDPRSMLLNTEIGVHVSSPLFGEAVMTSVSTLGSDDFSYRVSLQGNSLVWEDWQGGTLRRHWREPRAGWWRRLMLAIFSWLPIEDQL